MSSTNPTKPRYLRFWSGSSTNCRRWSAHKRTTPGAFLELEPSAFLVNGNARVSVWMHSYWRLLAWVFWTTVARGSSSLRARRGSLGTKAPMSLTTLISIQLFEEVVSKRKNWGAMAR